jgi:hypothetical protein
MLPEKTIPPSLSALLLVCRSCFTAPTFRTFCALLTGMIAQTRRRTVCGMLLGAGLERLWHHTRAHRLFSSARWSADEVGLALAGLVVERLLPAGAALVVAVDDTLFKRSGRKVFGAAIGHRCAVAGATFRADHCRRRHQLRQAVYGGQGLGRPRRCHAREAPRA